LFQQAFAYQFELPGILFSLQVDYFFVGIDEEESLTIVPSRKPVAVLSTCLKDAQISLLFVFEWVDFHQRYLSTILVYVINEVKLVFYHED